MTKRESYSRVTDPHAAANTARMRRVGGVPTRDLVEAQERSGRFDTTEIPLTIATFALGPYYRENVPASTPAGVGMRFMLPSDASTFATTGSGLASTQFSDGRVLGASIRASSDVTAGSITAGVVIDALSAIPISDCVLTTAHPRDMMVAVPWTAGIPFAAGEGVRAVVMTDASFAPATLEVLVTLYLAYEVGR